MPRRRRPRLAEDFMELLSHLPWWGCLLFGFVAYVVLHRFSIQPLPTPVVNGAHVNNMTTMMFGGVLRALASVGSVALPMMSVAAAAVSFFGRRRRRELLLHTTDGGHSAAAIDAMSWQDFELLIAEAFRLQGFAVVEKGGASADGGVDMELTKDGERWLVQVKHWRAKQVPVEVVRELAGVMPYRRAVGAYVVTSGRFTTPAEEFASGRGIKLVNGSKLQGLLKQARASLDAQASSASSARTRTASTSSVPKPTDKTPAPFNASAPSCPSCRKPMVRRQAKRGANAGAGFWGCVDYPACRGTRPA